jgi:hypothetical protein
MSVPIVINNCTSIRQHIRDAQETSGSRKVTEPATKNCHIDVVEESTEQQNDEVLCVFTCRSFVSTYLASAGSHHYA